MNTNKLKRFAQQARKKLIQQVTARLEQVLTTDSAELREKTEPLRKLREAINRTSKEQVIDKVAYTWFNRLMALRFMDANDYQPIGMNVVTPKPDYTLPELLAEAKQGNIPEELPVNTQHIFDLLDGKIPAANSQNEAYKELLIGACNHLHKVFPFLFERISDYSELLLPDDLISEFSIIQDVRDGMTIEDCQQVEIIGWLYQFYISEKKDEVFAAKSKVEKEDIPAATQLFTPRWIVEYMVQNTLGKLWLQNRPNSKLREHMPYFIDSPSVEDNQGDYLKVKSVEEIKLLDQACGSGHILVYAFELFTKIYEEEGYNPNEIPALIIEKNLFGFEIDERAAQLAALALMIKARSYHRRVLRKNIEPNILCYRDLLLTTDQIKETFQHINTPLSDELLHDLENMQQATNLGSLIIPKTTTEELNNVLTKVTAESHTTDAFLNLQLSQLKQALEHLLLLGQKCHCVVDNPPYMGGGNMNKPLADFVKVNYPDSKSDLMTCFMESGLKMLKPAGMLGMINLPSWLFLSSFDKLRQKLIKNAFIHSLLHMGRGIFGIDWGSTAFTIQNQVSVGQGKYFKLHKRNFQHIYSEDIRDIFLKAKLDDTTKINFDKYRESNNTTPVNELVDKNGLQISHTANQKDFEKIPGSPIGYWFRKKSLIVFEEGQSISELCDVKKGLSTSANDRFLRYFFEIECNNFKKDCTSEENNIFTKKWYPANKGGEYRKYFGNQEYVINWKGNGEELNSIKPKSVIRSRKHFFKKILAFSKISSNSFSIRLFDVGFISIDASSYLVEFKPEHEQLLLGVLSSKIFAEILGRLTPTLNFEIGDMSKFPIYLKFTDSGKEKLNRLVVESVDVSKQEWNSRETSWDYQQNELIRIKGQDLEEAYDLFRQYWKNNFFQLHQNEEELNKQFIEIYGLQEELTPDVPLKDITILRDELDQKALQTLSDSYRSGWQLMDGEWKLTDGDDNTKPESPKPDLPFNAKEIMAQFVSYAVGCMFGRYSLDQEGLILANQGETLQDYLKKVYSHGEIPQDAFLPDDDNIIPVLDDEWFEDDIVGRFKDFLKTSFGNAHFDKNLIFIEECLGKDIRKYFTRDFYADHVKRYKKRPIYWMFSSPKGSFNVLIYLHRYSRDTLNQILNGYLKEYREKLNTRVEQLDHLIETGSSIEQTKATKEKDKVRKILLELQEYERDILYPLATDRINIDLDDGVLVNYNKFGKAIKEVSGLNDKKTKDKVRKFDWIDGEEIR